MKKILVMLMLMLLTMPSFAVQVQTIRLTKDINDRCAPKITTNNYTCDFLKCFIQQVQQPYDAKNSVWRDGWSNVITANVYAVFATPLTNAKNLSIIQEKMLMPSAQMGIYSSIYNLYDQFNKAGFCSKKMPAVMVNQYRYGKK